MKDFETEAEKILQEEIGHADLCEMGCVCGITEALEALYQLHLEGVREDRKFIIETIDKFAGSGLTFTTGQLRTLNQQLRERLKK